MISLENRSIFTENNKKEIFDLIIIGGGITGAGILLDACSRGGNAYSLKKVIMLQELPANQLN